MKVMVTGVAGLLGSHIAEALVPEYEVIGIDSLIGGDLENVPEGVDFRLTSCEALRSRHFNGVDVVFHCAALAHEGLSVFSPAVITDSIFGASVRVFSAAAEAGVRRVVFCSSMARYGNIHPPFVEPQFCAPQDPYGIAKKAAEDVLRVLSDVHGLEYAIAVPHNIIGPRQKYDDPYRNVAAIMANLMLQGKRPYIYGDGTQMRCFTDVRDAVPPLLKMGFDRATAWETYNIGPDSGEVTINELASTLADVVGVPDKPFYLPDRPQEVKIALCSADKARRDLSYQPVYGLKDTLSTLVAWIRENGPKPFKYHLPLEIQSRDCPTAWTEELFNVGPSFSR